MIFHRVIKTQNTTVNIKRTYSQSTAPTPPVRGQIDEHSWYKSDSTVHLHFLPQYNDYVLNISNQTHVSYFFKQLNKTAEVAIYSNYLNKFRQSWLTSIRCVRERKASGPQSIQIDPLLKHCTPCINEKILFNCTVHGIIEDNTETLAGFFNST